MAITDLTGTKWQLQDKYSEFKENTIEELFCSLKAEDIYGVLLEYDFIKFGTVPERQINPSFFLEGWTPSDRASKKNMTAGNTSSSGLSWVLDIDGSAAGTHVIHTPLIDITGGAGTTDADVIAWFEANATQVVDGGNNKIVLGDGTVVMDITDTTAEEADVVSGKVFYKSNGARSTGAAVITPVDQTYDPTSTNAQSGTAVAQAVAGAGGASLVTQTQTTPGQPVTATLTDGDYGLRFDEAGNEIQIDFSDGTQTNTRFLAKSAYVNGITGDLSNLATTAKTNLVAAVNEVNGKLGMNLEIGVEKWCGTYKEDGVTYQVYNKAIKIDALPAQAGITTYDHGITGIKQILQVYGFCTNGFVMNAPRQTLADNITIYQVSKSATNQTISIEVGKDRSSVGAYVVLVYAKNN